MSRWVVGRLKQQWSHCGPPGVALGEVVERGPRSKAGEQRRREDEQSQCEGERIRWGSRSMLVSSA
jgi:hypothetical protein